MKLSSVSKFVTLALVLLIVSGCEGRSQQSARSREEKTPRAESPHATSTPRPTRIVATPTPRIIRRSSLTTTTQQFVLRPDGVFLPGYDDQPSTAGPELLRLDPDVFARTTNVFRGRAICTKPNNETTTFTMPAKAAEIGVALRGRAVEGEWPRIRVSLVDGKNARLNVPLFEGNVAWRELRYLWWQVPPDWRNKLLFLRVEVLNPNYYFSQRAVYIGPIIIRGVE